MSLYIFYKGFQHTNNLLILISVCSLPSQIQKIQKLHLLSADHNQNKIEQKTLLELQSIDPFEEIVSALSFTQFKLESMLLYLHIPTGKTKGLKVLHYNTLCCILLSVNMFTYNGSKFYKCLYKSNYCLQNSVPFLKTQYYDIKMVGSLEN